MTKLFVAFSYEDALSISEIKRDNDHAIAYSIDPQYDHTELSSKKITVLKEDISSFRDNIEFYSEIHNSFYVQIEALKTTNYTVWEYANSILDNIVYKIGSLLYYFDLQTSKNTYNEVVIYGKEYHTHFPVFGAEGEVVSRFEYYPMLLYTQYIVDFCQKRSIPYSVVKSKNISPITPLKLFFRDVLIDSGKLVYIINQRFKSVGFSFLFFKKKENVINNYDIILLIRNEIGASFFESFIVWAQKNMGKKILIICDEMLQRTSGLKMVKKLFPEIPLIYLLYHQNFYSVSKEWFKNRFKIYKNSHDKTIKINTKYIDYVIPVKPLEKQLLKSMIDKQLRKNVLNEVFKILPKKQVSVLSPEMISVDATLESEICQINGFKYWNVQVASIEPLHSIRIAPGEGFLVSSKHQKDSISVELPLEANKIHHIGLFRFPELKIVKPHVTKKLNVVTFFTQATPIPTSDNIKLLEILSELAEKVGFHLWVKPHPRDTETYHRFSRNPHIQILSKIGVLSVDVIMKSDLVIAQFSSTLQESLYIGVPYIAFSFDNEINMNWDFLDDKLGVCSSSLNDLTWKVVNYDSYQSSFYENRKRFLEDFVEPDLRWIF